MDNLSFNFLRENTDFMTFEQPSPVTNLSATFEELIQDVHSSPEAENQPISAALSITCPNMLDETSKDSGVDLTDETSKDSGVDLQEIFEVSPQNSPIGTCTPTSFKGLFTQPIKSSHDKLICNLFTEDTTSPSVTCNMGESPILMLGHHATRKHSRALRRRDIFKRPSIDHKIIQSPVLLQGHNATRKHTAFARRQGLKRKFPTADSLSCDHLDRSCDKKARQDFTAIQESLKRAVDKQNTTSEQLVGDGSHGYRLPTVTGNQQGLKYITPATMVDLLTGRIKLGENADYKVIDCRYPFEYAGGHIEGAVNLHTQQQFTEFLASTHETAAPTRDTVLIFHCEFSSERAPKRARFLRDQDRQKNGEMYPRLNYPEMYILLDGYKAFYEWYPQHCNPQGYTPMLHESHKSDMKKFRCKSKSWCAGDKSLSNTTKSALPRMRLDY